MRLTTHRRRYALTATAATLFCAALSTATFAPAAAAAVPATPHVGSVAGTVTGTGSSGAVVPVPGVKVLVLTTDATPSASLAATTDTAGHYRLDGVPVWATYRVCFVVLPAAQAVGATGFSSHCHGTSSPYPGPSGKPVAVKQGVTSRVDDVLPVGARIRATVVDPAGRPVAGVPVVGDDSVDGASGSTAADGTADLRGLVPGSARVCVDPSRLAVTTTDPGLAPTCVTATTRAGVASTLRVTLPAATGLSGRVVDPSGAPVAGASVHLGDADAPVVAVTDDNGRWRVGHLVARKYPVCITPPAGVNLLSSCDSKGVIGYAGKYAGAGRTLATAATVAGTVTDTAGNPLTNVTVRVVSYPAVTHEIVTGYDGRYRVAGLDPRAAEVCFTPRQDVLGGTSDNGFVASCRDGLTLRAGTTTINAALQPSLTVSGRLTDDLGRGVGGIPVSATGPFVEGEHQVVVEGTTTADGRYLLRNVPRGSYEVDVSPLGTGFGAPAGWESAIAYVEVGATPRTGVDLQIGRLAGFDVVVEGPSGEPLPDVVVRSTVTGSNGYVERATDADGRVQNPDDAGPARVCAATTSARPGYPGGLTGTCTAATYKAGVVTHLTLHLREAGA